MTEKTAQKHCEEYLTLCCKAPWKEKGKLNYRCTECDADVTMEIIFLYQALTQ